MSITMRVDRPAGNPFGRFRWEDAAGIWAKEAAPLGRAMLRSQAPFLTGALREGIKVHETVTPGRRVIMFYSQASYARFVLEGTRPHPIVPRNARVLRWVSARGHGPAVFAARVNHPGTKANPFPERAMRKAGAAVAEMFARACREAVEL